MRGLTAALATRHGKELLVDRALRAIGIELLVAPIDTDRFGTFDGEVPRALSPLDTAIAKARAALDAEPRAQLGIGSEGTFGAVDRELVAIVHRSAPLVVVGSASGEIVRVGARVETLIAAEDAAEHLGFPSAGVLVMTPQRRRVGGEVPHCGVLRDLVSQTLAEHGAAWIEPDRRAHRDPARRRVIEAAALDAASKLREACPVCGAPGFVIHAHELGLPCEACGAATADLASITRDCWACGHREQWVAPQRAPLADCERCHP